MHQANLSGQKNFGNKKVSINTPVFLFEEDAVYFAYNPSLDLTGYGKTQTEAMESMGIMLDEFFKYTLNKNTLLLELQRLGWKVKSRKKPMTAPQISDLIKSNEQLREIVNSKEYSTSNYPVNVPAFA